jgi:hypothetical protein
MNRWICCLLALALSVGPALQARTLNSVDGRSIEAEVLGYEPDGVRIRRIDTKQEFFLPYTALAEADQAALRAEAAAQAAKPAAIPAGSLRLELARTRFEQRRDERPGVIETVEQWGFTVTLHNQGPKALEGLRAEYVLFLEPAEEKEAPSGRPTVNRLRRQEGQAELGAVAAAGRAQFRTEGVEAVTIKLRPGWVWKDEDRKRTLRDRLEGVWVRVYRGDELILEQASPAGLITREPWAQGGES